MLMVRVTSPASKIEGQMEDDLSWWPNCETPDCEYKRNLNLGTVYCFQCSLRFLGITEEEGRRRIDEANAALRAVGVETGS